MEKYTLRISCTDDKGLVYKISKILLESYLNIERNDEFVDMEKNLFFMRTEFSGNCDVNQIKSSVTEVLPPNAKVEVAAEKVKNIIVFVTKEHHCISDLLIRNQYKEFNFNILAVIGNHDALKPLVEKFEIPFYTISSDGLSRESHEEQMLKILANYQFDYLVLAKFMRILTPNFVKLHHQKIVNIHHSFLPAFIGANPYKQAFQRGVKMIGATSHFVTDDLDEGPIIFQDIAKVNHSKTAKDLSKIGKEVEKKVLSEALRLIFEDRVFIDENKTIIFE